MKNVLKKLLILTMAVLMMSSCLISCSDKEEEAAETKTEQGIGGPNTSSSITENRLLSSFAVVRSTDSITGITDEAITLNKTIASLAGKSGGITVDENERKGNEIVIGTTTREESAYLKELKYGDYVFKTTVDSDGRCILLVGGTNNDATVKAVKEFIKYIEELAAETGAETEVPDIDMKSNVSELVISNSVAKQMAIIYSQNADENVAKIATYLRRDIGKALGKTPMLATFSATEDISKYPNAIVIGEAGKEAASIKKGFENRSSYAVKVDVSDKGTRVYIVGATNLSTVRAVQYFYSKSVNNGEFRIPRYLDVTAGTLCARDPGILLHDGKYYMYSAGTLSYVVRESEDMLNWSEPKKVWDASWQTGCSADEYFWAPECHYYNGYFYLFATFGYKSNANKGCVVLRCATPNGNFKLISKQSANATEVGWITPSSMNAIDGTLYVDEQGKPWMVFVREWTKAEGGVGRMSYAPLSDDLSYFTAEPKDMFKADDPSWTDHKITDGPWLYKTSDGTLLMIWSNKASNGLNTDGPYTVGIAKSSNGRLDGEWTQLDPLYEKTETDIYQMTDGGHGCIFRDYDGRLYLALHTINEPEKYIPNDSEYETVDGVTAVTFIPIVESNGTLVLDLMIQKKI